MRDYAELCGIMRIYAFSGIMLNYAFSGIMKNYAFSGRIMHLHNQLSPGNKQLTLGDGLRGQQAAKTMPISAPTRGA